MPSPGPMLRFFCNHRSALDEPFYRAHIGTYRQLPTYTK